MEKLNGLRHAAAMLVLLAAAPAEARDFPMEWHWVRVVPNGTRKAWDVEQSDKAQVTFTRGGFVAKLYDDADPVAGDQPDIVLAGRIDGKNARAVETQPSTDAGHWTLNGIIVHERPTRRQHGEGWGEDRISLYAGHEFIGLSRLVHSTTAPSVP